MVVSAAVEELGVCVCSDHLSVWCVPTPVFMGASVLCVGMPSVLRHRASAGQRALHHDASSPRHLLSISLQS